MTIDLMKAGIAFYDQLKEHSPEMAVEFSDWLQRHIQTVRRNDQMMDMMADIGKQVSEQLEENDE